MSGLGAGTELRAPFPWYGGKRRVADEVWSLLGDCTRYIEPFAGSLAVLLGRPRPFSGLEVVNDLDGYVVNAWRSIKHDPAGTAEHALGLVSELDLTARHLWLVNEGRELLGRFLAADPEWFDARVAGWWLQGVSCWIGTGFCSGKGPWTRARLIGGTDGMGVNRKLPHLGDDGRIVNRKLPHLGTDGMGVNRKQIALQGYMLALSKRLERVVIANGDWQRVLTTTPLGARQNRRVGVFLDPPYRQHGDEYGVDSNTEQIWQQIEAWCAALPSNVAVVLCGYEGDFEAPPGWREIAYTASGTSSDNRSRERFWVTGNCYGQGALFDGGAA